MCGACSATQEAESGRKFREWGGSGSIRYNHGGDDFGPHHCCFSIRGAASSCANQPWHEAVLSAATTASNAGGTERLESQIGYGVDTFNGRTVMTPYAALVLADNSRDWRIGSRSPYKKILCRFTRPGCSPGTTRTS